MEIIWSRSFLAWSSKFTNWLPHLVLPVFILEYPLQGGLAGLPKLEPRATARVYLGHYPLHTGSATLVLNTITGKFSTQYHVVFDYTVSTVELMRKGTVLGKWKNWYRSTHSLLHRKTSLLKNSGILMNPQVCPYSWRTVRNTHRIQVPKIRLQGLIPRLQPYLRHKILSQCRE